MVLAWRDEDCGVQMAAPEFGPDGLKRHQALCQSLGQFLPSSPACPSPRGQTRGSVSVNKSRLCRHVNLRDSLSSLERWPPGLTADGCKVAIAMSATNIKINY